MSDWSSTILWAGASCSSPESGRCIRQPTRVAWPPGFTLNQYAISKSKQHGGLKHHTQGFRVIFLFFWQPQELIWPLVQARRPLEDKKKLPSEKKSEAWGMLLCYHVKIHRSTPLYIDFFIVGTRHRQFFVVPKKEAGDRIHHRNSFCKEFWEGFGLTFGPSYWRQTR